MSSGLKTLKRVSWRKAVIDGSEKKKTQQTHLFKLLASLLLARWCRQLIHATMFIHQAWHFSLVSRNKCIPLPEFQVNVKTVKQSEEEAVQERGNAVEDSGVYHCLVLCKLVLHDSLSSLIKATSR